MRSRTRPRFQSEEALWRRIASLPLIPPAAICAAAEAIRRAAFGRPAARRSRFPGRVVSVGSLTRGGHGLAPLAAWVATGLRLRGHKVAIVGRGIGGVRSSDVTVVSDGRFVRSRAEIAGAGAMLLAAHAPGVPVLVGRNRALAGWRALSAFGADVLVLDDGFQFHRLARDLDVVVIDASLGLGNHWTFPRGPLRESPRALRCAQALGVIDGPLSAADERVVDRHSAAARRFEARLVAAGLRTLSRGAARSPTVLRDRPVGVFATTAEFGGLCRTLESLGARVVAERRLRNGHRTRRRDLLGLGDRAPLWITTERNAAEILPTWTAGVDLLVLRVGIEVAGGDTFLDWIDSHLH